MFYLKFMVDDRFFSDFEIVKPHGDVLEELHDTSE
jgi:hypothetical protein